MWSMAPLNERHIGAVIAIEKASFKNPWQRASFISELACREAMDYVATDPQGKQIIAYVCLRRNINEMHLLKIAVAPQWQRHGVATWLLNSCFQLARKEGVETVRLEVRPTNKAARAFYQKLGFRIIGTRPKYYTDTGEEALVLIKNLKEAP